MDDWRETWHGLHDVLGGKWAFHVLRALDEEPQGFNALGDALGVRPKTLSARLSELRCRGFVVHDPPDDTADDHLPADHTGRGVRLAPAGDGGTGRTV